MSGSRRTGSTSVLVTHSVDEAVLLGIRAVVLRAGPGTAARDTPVPLRGLPEYAALRAEVRAAVRETAR
ncbi:hypothetical protein [Streptomyces sp. NPDC014623]|uniref:hypothetical protein n=1 Tax=Streptomyces sp. NPDC014623 TaxID=3364875 RepID=UPI0036FCB7B1